GGTPLNFETGGSAVADLLSAGSLGFDASGNLFVGGADFYDGMTDIGYAALVDATAVQAALLSASATPPIDSSSPADVLRKFASPVAMITAQQAPIWAYNDTTGELYLRYFGSGAVSVYSVPEPSALCGLLLTGLVALRRRRGQMAGAAVLAVATSAQAYTFDPNDFATEVVTSANLPATSLYNDPAAVLGRPTLRFDSGNLAVPDVRRAKLIEGTFNTGPAGEKLITTFGVGQSLTVKMGRAITNDSSHPFGIDFNVFGNAFFSPGSIGPNTGDATNLNTTTLGTLFAENVRVSVSPDNVQWYSYTNGPTGDGMFPTNAYRWDRAAAAWTDDELDPTKAVNPALRTTLTGLTAADALDLYNGAAGGAGFDLAESPFASVLYVRFDGLNGYSGGEIDAVAAVVPEPAVIGLFSLTVIALLGRR
ncbi:MAG TPA: PEP-CTERM sorting domain-containing protein, partial [Tepidisphaeraceae bacterium]